MLLAGTKRMFGRCTASQIAAASAASMRLIAPKFVVPYRLSGKRGKRGKNGMPVLGEEPGPVVCARARFDPDRARRQRGDELMQLGSRYARANELRTAGFVDAVHGKDVL